jgi:DNA-binding CsgD family transcriptional regulator
MSEGVLPGLSSRDGQILALLRGGATIERVIAVGKHRKAWNAWHVGAVIGIHFNGNAPHPKPALTVVPPPAPKQPQRKVAEHGTSGGWGRHRRLGEDQCPACRTWKRNYSRQWAEDKRAAEEGSSLPLWQPAPFTGRATPVELTPAQVDVLRELCRGLSNRRISEALGCSEDTVKSHVKDILAALGASDRTHAVVMVLSGQVRVHGEPRAA